MHIYVYTCASEFFIWVPCNSPCGRTRIRNLRTMDPPSRGVESVRKHGTYDGLLGWKDGESMNIN